VPPADLIESWTYLDVSTARAPHVSADVQHLPFADATFDTVMCLEVLQYVDEPATALSEMRRVVRPNGALIVSTPFVHRPDSERDMWRFTIHGLEALCAAADLHVVSIASQGEVLASGLQMLRSPGGSGTWHRLVQLAVTPLYELVFALDQLHARWAGLRRTVTTGYVVAATRPPSIGDTALQPPARRFGRAS
jgi:SAM-dependent methyltransferase